MLSERHGFFMNFLNARPGNSLKDAWATPGACHALRWLAYTGALKNYNLWVKGGEFSKPLRVTSVGTTRFWWAIS